MEIKQKNANVAMGFSVEKMHLEVVVHVDSKGIVETRYKVFNTNSRQQLGQEVKDNAAQLVIKIFKESEEFDAVTRATEFLITEYQNRK